MRIEGLIKGKVLPNLSIEIRKVNSEKKIKDSQVINDFHQKIDKIQESRGKIRENREKILESQEKIQFIEVKK